MPHTRFPHIHAPQAEPDDLPTWCADCVLRGVHAPPKESKIAFILLPAEGSDLPSLMQSKLNAPRILQVGGAYICM
eukprot:356576-Chlamydomonas_euryale.AAC.2